MRILHILQSLDPAWGGIARVLPELAARLAASGNACKIATLAGDRFGAAPDIPGVEVLRFSPKPKSRLGRSPDFARAIESLIRDCDLVHLHGLWTAQNWSAGRAARKLHKAYIMTPHSMMMPWAWKRSAWKKRPAGWLFEYANLRRAACLHALADGEAAHMRALGFNQNIITIPNGIDAAEYAALPPRADLEARFPQLAKKRWLLSLGRIHPQKGIVQAMQAGFDVLASAADWHLLVVGPDELGLQRMLQAALQRKGLAARVTFTGALDRPLVKSALAGAAALLQPSKSEGLSMSILEALAAAIPVIISPACNMPEIADAGAGWIIEPRRRDIASALKKLITLTDEERRSMGRRGRALVKTRFDWPALIPRYQRMYKEAAQSH